MSNVKRYTSTVTAGVREGIKQEWQRTQTLGAVVEYAIVGKEARLAYAGVRGTMAVAKGAAAGHRAYKVLTEMEKANLAAAEAATTRIYPQDRPATPEEPAASYLSKTRDQA